LKNFLKNKKIDKNEKYKLILKYNRILDNYDKRILKLKPIVEIQDICEYRNQIYSLIFDSIEKLDRRLTEFSSHFDYFKKNNIKIDIKTSSVHLPLKAIDIFKRRKKNFMDNYKSSDNHIDKHKEKDLKISNYNDIKTNQVNQSKYTTDKDTDSIGNLNADKEVHLKYNNTSLDKINKTEEEEEEEEEEELDKIQKDILKILQRLESSS